MVLDLDGTLTNSQKEITPYTLEVMKRVQQSGVKLVLASGRPTYGIVPLAKQLEMDHFGGYILSFNGGKIIETKTMEVLYEQTLPLEVVPALSEAASKAGAVILSYRNEFILTEKPEDRYVGHEAFLTKMQPLKVDNFNKAIDFDPDKCLIVGDPERIIPLEGELNKVFGDKLSAYRSEPFFLEIVPKGIDKALSLKRLLEIVNLTAEQMIAMGDGYNDLSMIRLAGLGVAMANAQTEVKEAANTITPLTNDQDGVAHFVAELLGVTC